MWEGLASLFNNTLGSNGIGGAIGSMFTPSTVAGEFVNPNTLVDASAVPIEDTFGALGTQAPALNLYSGPVSTYSPSVDTGGSGLANMTKTIKGYMPGEDTVKMLGTGGTMYKDISSGLNQSKATKILQNQYNRDSARLAKSDADVEAQRAQSNRVWGGGL